VEISKLTSTSGLPKHEIPKASNIPGQPKKESHLPVKTPGIVVSVAARKSDTKMLKCAVNLLWRKLKPFHKTE